MLENKTAAVHSFTEVLSIKEIIFWIQELFIKTQFSIMVCTTSSHDSTNMLSVQIRTMLFFFFFFIIHCITVQT